MKRFLTFAVAMLALTGMGQVAMRKLEDLTNTNLVCVTDYGPQVVSLTARVTGIEGGTNDWSKAVLNLAALSNNVAGLSSRATETNELFSAWFSGLQSRTSYWDTAYSWGDWSVAVGANTAAIRILETNTVTRADTNGWETGSHASFLTSAPPQSVVSVNGLTGAVSITATSLGALTAEADLAALRAYHYGSPDIVESPAEWFFFDEAGTIMMFNWAAGRENVVIPWEIGGVPVTVIGANAFEVSGIVSLIAPRTVTSIESGAFYSCYALTSVLLPQVQTVGDVAFADCNLLASVLLPQVQTVGDGAFNSCYALTSVSFPLAQTFGGYAFANCNLLASVSLPQAQTAGDGAFDSCYALASVSLPQAQTIGGGAFVYCTSLTAVRMGQNAPAEATSVFAGITTPPTVYVTDPQATGWGAVWNGAPVVRPPLYGANVTAQAYTLNGDTITEWPSGGGGGATNITDGVTSGTYSEATRTLDISNLLAGVSMELPDGIVTNGADGPLALAGIGLTNGVLRAASGRLGRITLDDNGINDVMWGTVFSTQSSLQLSIEGSAEIGGFYDYSSRFYGCQGGSQKILELYDWKYGPRTAYFDHDGSLMSSGTVYAAEVRSTGEYIIGPTISDKQAHIFTDGTNCFFVNVNSVTNAAGSGSVPYADWTGTVTPQNGTATVAYAHGNMPVLVVPNGGGTTRVTVATGTYVATSGVSRVSLSIWAGTNTIELVTNEVDYASAPDIPTNGWGTILFRRVSNGKWKGVGL